MASKQINFKITYEYDRTIKEVHKDIKRRTR